MHVQSFKLEFLKTLLSKRNRVLPRRATYLYFHVPPHLKASIFLFIESYCMHYIVCTFFFPIYISFPGSKPVFLSTNMSTFSKLFARDNATYNCPCAKTGLLKSFSVQ